MEQLTIIAYIAAWATIIVGVFAFFDKANKVLEKKTKAKISLWLIDIQVPRNIYQRIKTFNEIFDSVFSRNHLSIKCFIRSSTCSLLSVVIIFILLRIKNPQDFFSLTDVNFYTSTAFIIVVCAITNTIPDYFSLLETRKILDTLRSNHSFSYLLLLIIVDILFTALIFFLFSYLVINFNSFYTGGTFRSFPTFSYSMIQNIFFEKHVLSQIFFFSTYLTSLWLYLYLLTEFVLSFLRRTDKFINFSLNNLSLLENPLEVISFVFGVVITIFFILGSLFLCF